MNESNTHRSKCCVKNKAKKIHPPITSFVALHEINNPGKTSIADKTINDHRSQPLTKTVHHRLIFHKGKGEVG